MSNQHCNKLANFILWDKVYLNQVKSLMEPLESWLDFDNIQMIFLE